MAFLTANWKNLILINYKIDPELLKPYVPKGTRLDFHNNTCYISLVGFMFKDTKVLNIKFPYHINFEEVNLRFYVKHKEKRGVVFIKEIVPLPLITFFANTLYKEHYQTCAMKHQWIDKATEKQITYQWKTKNQWQSISARTKINIKEVLPKPESEEEFIIEHYFGYTKDKDKTFEYEVEHPKWSFINIKDYNINVDFELNYGNTFKFLNIVKPLSVIFTKGSKIRVNNKVVIH